MFFVSNAQKNKQPNTYNTKIEKAEKVIFKSENGVINITKADTVLVGQVIINQAIKPQLKIDSFSQVKDTSGFYVTTINFINKESGTTNDVEIVLVFDKEVESVDWAFGGVAFNINQGHRDDKKAWGLKAGQITSSNGLKAVVKSKSKVFTTIYGVNSAAN